MCMTRMIAGPMITTNRHGRKKMIIGTVSLAGSAAAFCSASHHPHLAVFLGADAQGLAQRRAVALGLIERRRHRLDARMAAALGEILERLLAVGQIAEFGRGEREFLGQFGRRSDRSSAATLRSPLRRSCRIRRRSEAGRAHRERPP
jgi:hypothetical protein